MDNVLNSSIAGQIIQKRRGKINIRHVLTFLKCKAYKQVIDNSYA